MFVELFDFITYGKKSSSYSTVFGVSLNIIYLPIHVTPAVDEILTTIPPDPPASRDKYLWLVTIPLCTPF